MMTENVNGNESLCDEIAPIAGSSSSPFGAESLSQSLLNSQIDNMLEFLSKKKDLRLVNQQRDEPELTSEQRLDILKSVFASSPLSFLHKFGKHLEKTHLDCFSHFPDLQADQQTEIKLYAEALEKSLNTVSKSVQAKNRRYEALQKLVDTTDYFTEPAMQHRNPILFEQLVGKYHTKEEREAFLKFAESCPPPPGSVKTPLTDMLLAHMNRTDDNQSERRQDQENQMDAEAAADAEYLDDEEMEEDDCGYKPSTSHNDDGEGGEEIEDEEKDLLKEEFFTSMYRNFLEGKDDDFDYNTVDNNEEYDCGETLNQDEEDKYFDGDSDLCNSNSSDGINEMQLSPDLNPHGTHNEEESEDELDLYMKNIEKELQQN